MAESVSHHDAAASQSPDERLARVLAGDEAAFAECFAEAAPRLARMIGFRLDPRLRGRVDADDVLQEVYVDSVRRLEAFRTAQPIDLFLLLRLVVGQTLVDLHRRHLGAQMRDAGRERSLAAASPGTSASLSFHLVGKLTSPSGAVMRAESAAAVSRAIEEMSETDREILALRHFEELTNKEVAAVLGIDRKAASIRYIRALERLKTALEHVPGLFDTHSFVR